MDRHHVHVLDLFLSLRQSDVERRMFDQIIADDHARENMLPLNAEMPFGDCRDGGIWMFCLHNEQVDQIERQIRVYVSFPEREVIALHV